MKNTLKIGSLEHKELLCRTFIDTHDPFKPAEIRWPELDAESLARLKAMPIWNEATRTEAATAVKVQSLGDTEKDPLLAEAISLQGYEEGRHAEVLQLLARHYGIEVAPVPASGGPGGPDPRLPADRLRGVHGLLLRLRPLPDGRARRVPAEAVRRRSSRRSCRRRRATSSSSSTGRPTCGPVVRSSRGRRSTSGAPGTSRPRPSGV